jgi:hypothetical protein
MRPLAAFLLRSSAADRRGLTAKERSLLRLAPTGVARRWRCSSSGARSGRRCFVTPAALHLLIVMPLL